MAFVNKQKVTIGLTPEITKWGKDKAESIGMSLSVLIETVLREQMKKESEKMKVAQ